MPNLAHALSQTQGEIVHFPKTGQKAMSKKEDGFTRLPNVLIDTQIMAQLNDKAFKCLIFIIRQTLGFDRESHPISITQFQKYCGIKKRDTVISAIQSLEESKLIYVDRKLGHLSDYSLYLDQYHQKGLVPSKGTSPINGDDTSTVNGDGTSTVKQDTNKENIKYKFKNIKKETSPVDNFDSEIFSNSIEYHREDKKNYSLRELANVYLIKSDFIAQAKKIKTDLTDDDALSELKNFAQWSTTREKTTAQGWMNYWIYRIQKLAEPKAKSSKPNKPKSKGLSDSQVDYFASKLTNFHEFAAMYANVGETQKSFTARVASQLRDPKHLKNWASYLVDVGFAGTVEDFL